MVLVQMISVRGMFAGPGIPAHHVLLQSTSLLWHTHHSVCVVMSYCVCWPAGLFAGLVIPAHQGHVTTTPHAVAAARAHGCCTAGLQS
jgi:hypothetical protein